MLAIRFTGKLRSAVIMRMISCSSVTVPQNPPCFANSSSCKNRTGVRCFLYIRTRDHQAGDWLTAEFPDKWDHAERLRGEASWERSGGISYAYDPYVEPLSH